MRTTSTSQRGAGAATIDVERARAQTPGCAEVTHLNNAGASLMPTPVLEAVIDHLRLEARIGGYEASDAARERREATYGAIARLISCREDEVAVVENATRAWDMAFYAIDFRPGDRILTTSAEYGSNFLAYLQVARRTGATVEVVPDDDSGQLSIPALERLLDDRVKLVSVTHVPTNGGLVNPAEAIGAAVRESPALFLLDACQSAGQLPLDVDRIGCDLLTVTGRKFLRGPRGTGFLYARRDTTAHLEPPFLDVLAAHWDAADRYTVRADARRFESWESSRANTIGLGVAVEYALDVGIEGIAGRNAVLARRLRELLGAIPGVRVLDLGPEPCAIVSFLVAGVAPDAVRDALACDAVNVSVSRAEDTRIDMEQRGLDEWVRASVHYFNTERELETLARVVAALAHSGVSDR